MVVPSELLRGYSDRGRAVWRPVLFCLLFFVAAMAAIAYFLDMAADRANRKAVQDANHLMRTALDVLGADLESRLVDYAWWDDTVEQVRGGIDEDWALDNIGEYLQDAFGYSGTYVVNANLATIYAASEDETTPRRALDFLGPAGYAFLADVQNTTMAEVETQHAFFRVGDQVYIVAAGPITPEYPTAKDLVPAPRPVLIFHQALDEDVLANISEQFLLKDVKLSFDADAAAGIPIMSTSGDQIAWVSWMQSRPGDALIHDLLPKVVLVTLLLLASAVTIFLLWTRAAMAANVAKAKFLAKMSHELRTPLNPIIGFSAMMEHEIRGPLPNTYKTYAGDIHQSALHLQHIIEDLLDLSKIEAGTFSLREAPINIAELIDEVSNVPLPNTTPATLSGSAPDTVTFKRDIQPNLPELSADPVRLRQVLINLISNAIKFSGGADVAVRAASENGAIRIEVEDQGGGISAEDIPKVFEPFVQVGTQEGTRSERGTGLGLTISRELMKLHGGTLELNSELGRGTTAILMFPAERTLA